jgi:hypothetical protein
MLWQEVVTRLLARTGLVLGLRPFSVTGRRGIEASRYPMKFARSRSSSGSLNLHSLTFSVFASALATVAPSRADDTYTTAVPLAAAATVAHATESPSPLIQQPQPPKADVRAMREDTRHFPAFGSLSIAGATYYTYRFEGHVHSKYSRDAKHAPVDILNTAQRLGLDALVITDHGVSYALADFANYHGPLVPFVGREIGGQFGHAVMWNVAEDDVHAPKQTTLQQRADFAHRNGGLLVFAHPGWWIDGNDRDPMEWMTPEAMRRGGVAGAVDAIELWNGVYRTPLQKLTNAWVKLLEAGVYVPIVGNSDFHNSSVHKLGNAHNLAICDRPEVATCLWSAVKAGRIVVTDGPAAVFTVNDRLPGSIIEPDGTPLRVNVDALAPEGGTLQLYSGRNVVQKLELQPGVRAQAEWQIESPANDSFLRIDILRPHATQSQTPVSLLSNPVLVDVAPSRSSWR